MELVKASEVQSNMVIDLDYERFRRGLMRARIQSDVVEELVNYTGNEDYSGLDPIDLITATRYN